jgi:general secretion pathway protein M
MSGVGEVFEQGMRRWAALQPRERRIVGIGGGLLVLLLAWLLAFEPAWIGRKKLAAELPTLRGQRAQMEGLAVEARRLSSQAPQGVDTPAQLKVALEQSIEAAGLKGAVSQITVAGDLIDLRFKGVPFASWVVWFDGALRETRLRAVDVAVERETAPGMVSARLTLEAQKRGP